MERTRRGVGIAAGLPPEEIRRIAERSEALGYATLWVTDGSRGDGVRALAEAAAVTLGIELGFGVIPLTLRSPEQILEAVEAAGLPVERLVMGIGSGPKGPGALERVREAADLLRERLGRPVVIGALGPRMSRLAGEAADGVLFSWLGRGFAPVAAGWTRAAARQAGRPAPLVASYVRVAVGPAAAEQLARDGTIYAASPAYADHFARMGIAPVETAVRVERLDQVRAGLATWDGLIDELIVKPVTPPEAVDELLAVLAAAAPVG